MEQLIQAEKTRPRAVRIKVSYAVLEELLDLPSDIKIHGAMRCDPDICALELVLSGEGLPEKFSVKEAEVIKCGVINYRQEFCTKFAGVEELKN